MTTSEQPAPGISPAEAAKELLAESGLTANQIGRLTDAAGRSVHYWAAGTTPGAYRAERILALHALVFSLDAETPDERRRLMLSSARGESPFRTFQRGTIRPQQIQFPIPVMERFGAA